MVCNCCGDEAERDLFDKTPSIWSVFKTKSRVDEREKVVVAVCPACTKRIADLVSGFVPDPPSAGPVAPIVNGPES